VGPLPIRPAGRHHGKSGRLRDVPLTKRAAMILQRQPRGMAGPWTGLKAKPMSELGSKKSARIAVLFDPPRPLNHRRSTLPSNQGCGLALRRANSNA